MSLKHAILGLLRDEPMTGYDLKHQHFDESVTYFWSADQAQIYRTLDKLAEKGLVESELEIQEDRPNRKVYNITEAGRRELQRWLKTPQKTPTTRNPLLVQLYFARDVSNEALFKLLDEHLDEHRAMLETYEQIPLPPLDDPTLDRETTLIRSTLELGMRFEEMTIRWLEDTKQALQRFDTVDETP